MCRDLSSLELLPIFFFVAQQGGVGGHSCQAQNEVRGSLILFLTLLLMTWRSLLWQVTLRAAGVLSVQELCGAATAQEALPSPSVALLQGTDDHGV